MLGTAHGQTSNRTAPQTSRPRRRAVGARHCLSFREFPGERIRRSPRAGGDGPGGGRAKAGPCQEAGDRARISSKVAWLGGTSERATPGVCSPAFYQVGPVAAEPTVGLSSKTRRNQDGLQDRIRPTADVHQGGRFAGHGPHVSRAAAGCSDSVMLLGKRLHYLPMLLVTAGSIVRYSHLIRQQTGSYRVGQHEYPRR